MRDEIGSTGAGAASFTGDASRAVESSWPMFASTVTRIAERLTDDKDEREDLVQEAMIKLWKADPTRFDLRDRVDVRYLQKILVHRMWDVWGRNEERLREMAARRA